MSAISFKIRGQVICIKVNVAATQGRACVEGKWEALYPHEEVMHLMACLGPVTRPTHMSYIWAALEVETKT